MTNIDPYELVSRYVAVWNQPDAELRRKAIGVPDLWAKDGAHILQPPQEMRQAAAGLGFPSPVLEACGHDELEVRVTRAHEEFVAPGKFTFKSRDNADRLGNVVKFTWEMVPSDGGAAAGAGLEILVLDEDGPHQDRLSVHRALTPPPGSSRAIGNGQATRSARRAPAI